MATALAGAVLATPGTAAAAEPAPGPAPVTCSSAGWVGAWAAVPGGPQRFVQEDTNGPSINVDGYPLTLPRAIANESLRMITTPETSGTAVRVHLSNRYGTDPITFANVHVGRQQSGSSLVPGSNKPLTFSGADKVTVPPGQDVVSDPVAITVAPFDKLAVSFHVPQVFHSAPTYHWDGNHTSYLSPPLSGDHAAEENGNAFGDRTSSIYYVDAVDVYAPAGTSAVAVLGDSFTNSVATTADADRRWPDFLTRRLQATPGGSRLSVVDSAISFNFASPGIRPGILGPNLVGIGGPSGVERFRADVASVPGVRAVVVVLGMNDLAFFASADEVIDAYRQIVDQAHRAGLKAIGGTLTPTAGAEGVAFTYGLPGAQANRKQVNDFVRNSGLFDGVVDFAAAVSDPNQPDHWAPGLSPDNVHPNDQGAEREANAIDVAQLQDLAGCH
ncbi:SGNH hydrolase [Longimycelium tulufanense]|uniref:SGNH hydrolase n=1 Tax=Longimycelium tulufanense TaxID=907463 RepID=A0A8J3FT30_9PSEU|nr:GDSL-type esterase/lipase family protein [Longimycelium tulufanense]GGM45426.1 SGNH hydrolase [Longimycelium tulufanense]